MARTFTSPTRLLAVTAFALGLAACGGGGGSSTEASASGAPTSGSNMVVVDGMFKGATVSWEAPAYNLDGSPAFNLAGYRVYVGSKPGVYDEINDVPNPATTSYSFDGLSPGTYYMAVTAYDQSANESPYSEVASLTIQ